MYYIESYIKYDNNFILTTGAVGRSREPTASRLQTTAVYTTTFTDNRDVIKTKSHWFVSKGILMGRENYVDPSSVFFPSIVCVSVYVGTCV